VVFYGLPDHAAYYSELINGTLEHNDGVDETEVAALSLFSPFDGLKMERILGAAETRRMCGDADSVGRYTFAT
jgi:hypothetical protein